MIKELVSSEAKITTVHFCTLNLEKSVRKILENLGWTCDARVTSTSTSHSRNKLIEQGKTMAPNHGAQETTSPTAQLQALSVSPEEAVHLAEYGLKHKRGGPGLDGESHPHEENGSAPGGQKGQNENGTGAGGAPTGTEDSWDEFPNGRFTDVRSPAYGEIDGWGNGLKITVSRRGVV